MRNIPDQRRVTDEERIFFDDYRPCTYDDVAEVHLAYGERISLLKKVKTPNREIDTSGRNRSVGPLGGRRSSVYTGGQPVQTDWGRPEENDEQRIKSYTIPALVELSGQARVAEGAGISIDTEPTIRFSAKILNDMGLEVDVIEDLIYFDGTKYKFTRRFPDVFFLDMIAEYQYGIEETH